MSTNKWQIAGIIALDGNNGEKSCRKVVERVSKSYPSLETVCIEGNSRQITTAVTTSELNQNLVKRLNRLFNRKLLSVYGHGSYHHLTYGLCKYASNISSAYSYIHIDHHNDSYRIKSDLEKSMLNCGNFVPYIFESTNAKDVLYIGSSKPGINDEPVYKLINNCGISMPENISGELNENELLANLNFLSCNDVYITMDLDVMDPREIITGYSRGSLSKEGLLKAISIIKNKKNIIGVDILGYSEVSNDVYRSARDYNDLLSEMPEMELLSVAFDNSTYERNERIRSAMQEKSFRLYEDIIRVLL